MSKFGAQIFKHKNSDISETNSRHNLKLTHKVPCLYVHNMPKFQLPTLSSSKGHHQKYVFVASFKTLCLNSFQDPHIVLNISLFVSDTCIQNGSDPYEISFQDPHSWPLYLFSG